MSPDSIDWVLCNGGADIWHAESSADGKRVAWEADEQWERHIDWRCAAFARDTRVGPRAAGRAMCDAITFMYSGAGSGLAVVEL